MSKQIARRAANLVSDRLRDEPVVALQGPRTVGKSTLLADVAAKHGVQVIDLDNPAVREAVSADPSTFVSGAPPVCIDEFQKAPIVLDAIKAELNRQVSSGRFVITGSTRFDGLPRAAQALTGRIHIIDLLPFSQGESEGNHENFLEIAASDPSSLVMPPRSLTTRNEYIQRICRGGMPLAVARNESGRNRWFDNYVRVALSRDVTELSKIRQGALLPTLLRHLAGQSGQMLNIAAASRATGLEPKTAEAYTKLLEDLFLIRRVEAWGRTLRSRASAYPKIHVVDSGIAARLMKVTPQRLAQLDPAALSEFGHLLETFVVGELYKQASWSDEISAIGHWRTHDGQEVDLIIEDTAGSITAFEVKASTRIQTRDTRGLRALRNTLADTFNAGFILHTGESTFNLEDKIIAAPIDKLWTTHS